MDLRDNHHDIVDEHVDRNRQQNHAEEFSQDKDEILSHKFLNLIEMANHHVIEGDVEQQSDEDVDDGVVGAQ